jgi:hypothetical protein
MARRDRGTTAPAPEATASTDQADQATAPTEEAAVTTTATEVPAQAEASTTTESTEKPKTVIDLSGFETAVEEAVAQRDESTGDLSVEALAPAISAYRALDGIAAKNKAKTLLTDKMRDAMSSLDIQLARSYMVVQDNLSAGTTAKAERQPADPTEAYVQRQVGLDLARALIVRPEGVADDAEARAEKLYSEVFPQAEQYLAWSNDESDTKGDEPDVPAFVKGAVKLAQGKAAKVGGSRVGGTSSGERHDIGEHIRQAFENVPSGQFLTIAEIRNSKSTEYGDNPPSAGAISARLFPQSGKCSLEFVTPGQNDKGNRGATKV